MNLPITIGMWLLAGLPIVLLLYLMVGRGWGAYKAAPVGLVIALISGLVFYRANLPLIKSEILKGAWNTLSVLLVVWPAILLYEVVNESKAFIVFRQELKRLTPNELLQILAIGWVFVSFLQGITGFGVPVAVGAPILLGLGVKPLYAVIIPLLGHAWAGTFGTLAVAWDALVLQTNLLGMPEQLLQTGLWAGLFIWIYNFSAAILICWFYGKWEGVKKGIPAVALISLIQGGGQLLLTQVNTTLAAFLPATIGLVVILLLNRTKAYGTTWNLETSPIMDRQDSRESGEAYPKEMSMHQAFFPYYALTLITLLVLLIRPLNRFLSQWAISLSFPETQTGYGFINPEVIGYSPITPLTHAGLFLLLAAIIGYFYYLNNGWLEKASRQGILRRSIQKTIPPGLAILGFIIMSRIMGGTGQTYVLAQGIATTLGLSYVIFSPLVGLLGAFMTSSNMSSNILFGGFQLTIAELLGVNGAKIVAAQTAGGTVGTALTPGSIVLGATTAGIMGQEGKILKKLLPIGAILALVIGALVYISL